MGADEEIVLSYPAPVQKRKKIVGVGIVKAVTSGDSLVLMGGVTRGGVPSEKHITLSGVIAPSFARTRHSKDADFAFMSRECLRRKCIGKRVRFVIHYIANQGGRDRNYADVIMEGTNLANYMLRQGLVTVKMPNSPEAKVHPEKRALLEIQEEVKKGGLGMWNTSLTNQVRDVNWTADPRALYEQNKGKYIPAIIDHVREGHCFRVELLGPYLDHTMITLQLAGVHCPRVPKPHYVLLQEWERDNKSGSKPQKEEPEKFALEARFYSEARLLHREVQVAILGVDRRGNFFGSIRFRLGNISVKLLENGLGKLIPWSAKLNDENTYLRLLTAERLAKQRRAYLWEKYDESQEESDEPVSYQALVNMIYSGESMSVTNLSTHEKLRINLASIRTPRLGFRGLPDEPLAMDAREWVRRRIIGKKVVVKVEFTRPSRRNQPPMQFCTVLFQQSDVAEGLVSQGLASVVRHRETEPRSSRYEQLMVAEDRAVADGKGRFAKRLPSTPIVEDLTQKRGSRKTGDDEGETDRNARQADSRVRKLLPLLTRKLKIEGVVEYVFNGARFKVYLPSQHIIVSFVLAGVRTPDKKKEPELYASVVKYITSKLTQRTVQVNVKGADKGDSLIGGVWLGRLNLAVHLVQKGYASVFTASARELDYKEELFKYQRDAKERKLGVWKNWTPPVREPVNTASSSSDDDEKDVAVKPKKGQEFINVKITEINDADNFYVQVIGDEALSFVEEQMAAFSEDVDDVIDEEVKLERGKIYAGKFTDGRWYRIRNEGRTFAGSFKAFFLDYGNRAELKRDQIRALPNELVAIAGLARQCCLAGLRTPQNVDYKEESTYDFGELCFDRQLLAKVELAERGNKLHLTLLEADNPVSINNQLLRNGSLRADQKPHSRLDRKLVAELIKSEAIAKSENLGVWEYGDVSDSDGESNPKRYDGRPPRRQG